MTPMDPQKAAATEASSTAGGPLDDLRHLLVVAPSWLGDALMAVPALQAWQAAHPAARVTLLAKPAVRLLAALLPGLAGEPLALCPGLGGTWRTAAAIRRLGCDAAVLLPNAFRAGLLAALAGVPRRRGTAGHGRRALLNEVVDLDDLAARHQSCEAFRLFGLPVPPRAPPGGRLEVPPAAAEAAAALLPRADTPWVAVVPGAARGPSKRWPAAHFVAAARAVATRRPDVRFAVCGTAGERDTCAEVARGVGATAIDLCGRTDLAVLAALFARCRAVCCNDSGGMHLAAAAGSRVVALFGLTDPAKTGPLGAGHRVFTPEGVRGKRAVPRDSPAAAAALASIAPGPVAEALLVALSG